MSLNEIAKPRFQDQATAAYMGLVDEGEISPSFVGIGLAHGVALTADAMPGATVEDLTAQTFDAMGYRFDGSEFEPNEAERRVVDVCARAIVDFANQGVSA